MTIVVGPDQIEFSIHEKVLSQDSDSLFFQKVFSNGFSESRSGRLELPEDEPQAFETFLRWVYAGSGGTQRNVRKFLGGMEGAELLGLYVIAVKYLATSLHDTITSSIFYRGMRQRWDCIGFTKESLDHFAANTHPNCAMRKLITDLVVRATPSYCGLFQVSKDAVEMLPDSVLREAFTRIYRIDGPMSGNDWMHTCSYHCHTDKSPCMDGRDFDDPHF